VIRVVSETVGPYQENSYLVVDDAAGRAVLVDPGDEPDLLLRMIARSGATLDAIWLTHAHFDHVGAINGVRRVFPVPVYLHPLDRPLYNRAAGSAGSYGVALDQPEPPDRELGEGDVVTVGALRFDVLHLPGHAPGHVAFLGHDLVLSGDVLFRGSIGRTDLEYCNGAHMNASLERLGALPGATVVYPGHDQITTIEHELATNPFLNGSAIPVHR